MQDMKRAATTRIRCWHLFYPPGTDGHSVDPTSDLGLLLGTATLTRLPGGACFLPAVPKQCSTSTSCLGKYINTCVSCHSCQPGYESWSLHAHSSSPWLSAFGKLQTSLHLLLPLPFQLILMALSISHVLHPKFPFWGVFSLKSITYVGGFLFPNFRRLQDRWLNLSQLARLPVVFSITILPSYCCLTIWKNMEWLSLLRPTYWAGNSFYSKRPDKLFLTSSHYSSLTKKETNSHSWLQFWIKGHKTPPEVQEAFGQRSHTYGLNFR